MQFYPRTSRKNKIFDLEEPPSRVDKLPNSFIVFLSAKLHYFLWRHITRVGFWFNKEWICRVIHKRGEQKSYWRWKMCREKKFNAVSLLKTSSSPKQYLCKNEFHSSFQLCNRVKAYPTVQYFLIVSIHTDFCEDVNRNQGAVTRLDHRPAPEFISLSDRFSKYMVPKKMLQSRITLPKNKCPWWVLNWRTLQRHLKNLFESPFRKYGKN